MKTNRTPGEWELVGRYIRNPLNLGGWLVAELPATEHGGSANQANARLIAAAPEMLSVLQAVADYWCGGDIPEEIYIAMRAVIAKATGE